MLPLLVLLGCLVKLEVPLGDCVPSNWYADSDVDGFGDGAAAATACEPPTGFVVDGTDCDDANPSVHPGADEICDTLDNDCDSLVEGQDDSLVDAPTWYADNDGDGYGGEATADRACQAPTGTLAESDDCDDADGDVHPNAEEVCDGLDNDCDGLVDTQDDAADGGVVDATMWYTDADSDRYGDPDAPQQACEAPPGTVANDADCDDAEASVNPGASEICDGMDNDCDGLRDGQDDDVVGAPTWYTDSDGDGYGDPSSTQTGCSEPPGAVASDDDCDDGNAGVNPGASEVCDGTDNDCDGLRDGRDDSVVDAATWYTDDDGDGFGDPASTQIGCGEPPGAVASDDDCDDGDRAVNPDAAETCDGTDNDCDGLLDADDDSVVLDTWYLDSDGDGLGDASITASGCTAPSGYVASGTDCDDADSSVGPCEGPCVLGSVAHLAAAGSSQVAVDADHREIIAPAYDVGPYALIFDADTYASVTIFATEYRANPVLVDPIGDQIWVGNPDSGSITVVERGTHTPVTTLTGFVNPHSIVQDPDTGYIFVGDHEAGDVTVFDPLTLTELGSVSLGYGITQMSIGDGSLFVPRTDGTLTVVDTTTLTVVDSIMLTQLYGSAYVAGTDRLFAAGFGAGIVYVLEASTLSLVGSTTVSGPYQLKTSADGTQVAVPGYHDGTLSLLDATTGTVLDSAPACNDATDVAEDTVTGRWVVTCATRSGLEVMECL